MQKIARFHKVSQQRFVTDWCKATGMDAARAKLIYDQLHLPRRATVGSAGYDFFSPVAFSLVPRESIRIPTGIRAEIEAGWLLQLYPRSSLGFTYRLQMDNTVGIVDSDYFHADNEGHIFIQLTNTTHDGKLLHVAAQERFAQGVFVPFGITVDDDAADARRGGLGSTGKGV